MLRRTDLDVLIRLHRAWPLWSSLVLHVALASVCCIPHAPKVHDCVMVDLQMPRAGLPGPRGGSAEPRSQGAPAGMTVPHAPSAVPAHHETHEQMLPAKPQAALVTEQKASVAQTPPAPLAGRGADSGATARGQASAASAQAGGADSGAGKANATGGAGGAGGEGPGGSGGAKRPVDGVFGARGGPAYLRKVLPVYPRFAQRLGKEGTVLLRLTLDENGTLQAVEVVEKAGHGFEEAALAAVSASAFRPAMHNGRAVPCRALLPVRFELKD